MEQARAQIAGLEGDLPILLANPSSKQITGSLILFNFTASMLFVIGIAGMALAAMGTYESSYPPPSSRARMESGSASPSAHHAARLCAGS